MTGRTRAYALTPKGVQAAAERITVSRYAISGRWQVRRGKRQVGIYWTHADALAAAVALADSDRRARLAAGL